MKKLVGVLLTVAVAVSLMAMPAVVSANPGYDSSLTLENKDASWHPITGDGISGFLEYNATGLTFDFSFSATGLENSTKYSLIYYADKPDRFVDWGGNNPGALIANFTTDGSGAIAATAGSVELNMDLPCAPDANIAEISYCGAPDYYDHCYGAKIWLVPTEYLPPQWPNDGTWMSWNSTIVSKILFETDLITYDDTGSSVSLTATVPDIVAISVNPTSINFGTLLPGSTSQPFNINVTNIGTRTVDVDADVYEAGLFYDNLQLWTTGGWSFRSWLVIVDDLVMGDSKVLETRLPVPSTYTPSGSETATLIFTATAV